MNTVDLDPKPPSRRGFLKAVLGAAAVAVAGVGAKVAEKVAEVKKPGLLDFGVDYARGPSDQGVIYMVRGEDWEVFASRPAEPPGDVLTCGPRDEVPVRPDVREYEIVMHAAIDTRHLTSWQVAALKNITKESP